MFESTAAQSLDDQMVFQLGDSYRPESGCYPPSHRKWEVGVLASWLVIYQMDGSLVFGRQAWVVELTRNLSMAIHIEECGSQEPGNLVQGIIHKFSKASALNKQELSGRMEPIIFSHNQKVFRQSCPYKQKMSITILKMKGLCSITKDPYQATQVVLTSEIQLKDTLNINRLKQAARSQT